MVVEFKARRDLIVDGPQRDPGHPLRDAARGVLRVPGHRGDRPDRAPSSPSGCSYEADVCVLAGTAFGGVGTDHIRISYANSRENLTEALGRIGPVRRPASAVADRPKVFVARRIPEEGLEPSARRATWTSGRTSCRRHGTSCCAGSPGVDGVLTLLTDRVDDEFLDAAGPQLRVVSNYAVGFDNIDVAACARRGIPVGNTPGVLTETTADLAWALLMAAARRLPEGDRYVRAGSLEDVGAAAAARPRRPRRDDRHRRVRADRPGGGATGAGVRDGDPVPRPRSRCRPTSRSRSGRRTCRSRSCCRGATSCRST